MNLVRWRATLYNSSSNPQLPNMIAQLPKLNEKQLFILIYAMLVPSLKERVKWDSSYYSTTRCSQNDHSNYDCVSFIFLSLYAVFFMCCSLVVIWQMDNVQNLLNNLSIAGDWTKVLCSRLTWVIISVTVLSEVFIWLILRNWKFDLS